MRAATAALALAALSAATAAAHAAHVVAPAGLSRAPYAEWALGHWIWPGNCLSGTDQPCKRQDDILRLVQEYLSYDIPVANINIDSGWETHYNSFIIDEGKYPDMAKLISDIHALGSHVTFWMTGHINDDSEVYQYCKDNKYLLNDGQLIGWWHGDGALFDFTNPEAVEWLKTQLDVVLDIGADGWKLDATDPYVYILYPAIGYNGQPVTKETYSDLFYRTFYEYTLEKNPEGLIMSRPVDALPPGLKRTLRIPYTPTDICVAGWVGDQDPTFYGMQAAILNMFASAEYNYVNIGSDIGGFRSDTGQFGSNGRQKELLIRWTQLGALNPLMENGGNNEHRPWKFDTQTLEIYRNWVYLHEELFPFFYSKTTEGFEQRKTVMQPQGKCFWRPGEDFPLPDPCTYEYKLADDLFVAAMVSNDTSRTVNFPGGADWLDWFDESTVYRGNETAVVRAPLEITPLYRRVGAVIPLRVPNTLNKHDFGMDLKALPGLLTLLVVHPFHVSATSNEHFGAVAVHEPSGPGLDARFWVDDARRVLDLSLTALEKPIVLSISGFKANRAVVSLDRLQPACFATGAADCQPLAPLQKTGLDAAGVQLERVRAHVMGPTAFHTARDVVFHVDHASERLLVFVPAAIAAAGSVLQITTEAL